MIYCIVNSETNIIENMIVCDSDEIATEFGAVSSYEGAAIGDAYSPPAPDPTTEERVAALEEENALLKAQVSAQSDQMDFYEECIAEMAEVVYA